MFRRLLKPLLAVLFVLGILLALPSTRRAVAANFYAITEWAIRYNRVNPASLPPQCSLGNDCTYVSSVDGKAYHRNAAGGDVIMEGAGGSGIGNWLFSGNNTDIASSGTSTMGGTNVTQWLWNASGALRMTLTASALYSNNGTTLGDGGAYWPNAFLNQTRFQAASSQTAALFSARDSSGNAHYGVDSYGLPSLGARFEHRINFQCASLAAGGITLTASATNSTPAGCIPDWAYSSTANATGFVVSSGLATGSPISSGVAIGSGTLSTNATVLQAPPFVNPNNLTNLEIVAEWATSTGATGVIAATARAGLSNLVMNAANTNPGGYYFQKTSASANWFCVTNDGAAGTPVDTTVASTSAAAQMMRIEYYGAGTPLGAKTVKFYIDGTLVCTRTANVYSAAQVMWNAYITATGGISQVTLSTGPVLLQYNQVAAAMVP